ncbi:MAG: AmmeMemoRadiSam system protein B [bacterium]|nr:MAG: AmmeMemoRadiSam system protein B [bacterium]
MREAHHSTRQPAVAGRFYSGSGDALRTEVMGLLGPDRGGQPAIGVVMPHAGYVYSGGVAAETAAAIRVPRNVVVLGPNHTGLGPAVSVFPDGNWHMPFGDIPVNGALAGQILDRCEIAHPEVLANLR